MDLSNVIGKIVNVIVMLYRGYIGMSHTAAARAGIDVSSSTLWILD